MTETDTILETHILRQPQKAVWGKGKGRIYRRHSVDTDFKKFSGFKVLQQIVDSAPNDFVRAFIVFLWATGGRVTETLHLRKAMFTHRADTDPPILVVTDAPLEKRYKKTAEYIKCELCGAQNPKAKECGRCGADLLANGKRHFRTAKIDKVRYEFIIRLDDPFADIMLEWLQKHDGFLFLNSLTQKPFSRKWAYVQIREIGDKLGLPLWPHRFRAERASYLGTRLQAESLLEWFSWENWATAKKYAKKGAFGLAKELGVKMKGDE